MNIIKELRKKPRAVKNQYAIVGAFLVTAIIGSFWAFSLPARLGSIAGETPNSLSGSNELSDVLDTIGSQVGNAVESFQNIDEPQAEHEEDEAQGNGPFGEGVAETTSSEDLLPDSATLNAALGTTSTSEASKDDTPTSTKERIPQTVLIGTSTSGLGQ